MPDSRTGAAPDQPDEPGPWARWLVEVAEPWLPVGVEDFERAIEAARPDGAARLRVQSSGGFRIAVLRFQK